MAVGQASMGFSNNALIRSWLRIPGLALVTISKPDQRIA